MVNLNSHRHMRRACMAIFTHTKKKIQENKFCFFLFYFSTNVPGFPATLTCTLFNTSFVPMNFSLRVLGDGSGSQSVSSSSHVSNLSHKNWKGHAARVRPVEFTIIPAAGSVRAMSDVNIKV